MWDSQGAQGQAWWGAPGQTQPCHSGLVTAPHTWSWHRRPPRSKAVRAPSENAPQPRPALARPFPALPCFQVPFVPASAGAWFAACRWCYRPAFPRSQSSAEETPPVCRQQGSHRGAHRRARCPGDTVTPPCSTPCPGCNGPEELSEFLDNCSCGGATEQVNDRGACRHCPEPAEISPGDTQGPCPTLTPARSVPLHPSRREARAAQVKVFRAEPQLSVLCPSLLGAGFNPIKPMGLL